MNNAEVAILHRLTKAGHTVHDMTTPRFHRSIANKFSEKMPPRTGDGAADPLIIHKLHHFRRDLVSECLIVLNEQQCRLIFEQQFLDLHK